MIKVYINYPVTHITIHSDPNCRFKPKPNQRNIIINLSTLSSELEKFFNNEYRFIPKAITNGMWLQINFNDLEFERAVVEYIRKLLSMHHEPFKRVIVKEHCQC
jgi:hypothetical protein